jgi:hypothetical protein
MQSVKWWERKNHTRSQSVGLRQGLKPLKPKKEKKVPGKFETLITNEQLFMKFQKAGNIDRPDLGIPLVPIEKAKKLHEYVEECRAKKQADASGNFF